MDTQQDKIDELFKRGILEKAIKKELLIKNPKEIVNQLGKQIKSISLTTLNGTDPLFKLDISIRNYEKYRQGQVIYLPYTRENRDLISKLINSADYRVVFIWHEYTQLDFYYDRLHQLKNRFKLFFQEWFYVLIYLIMVLYYASR